MHCMAKSGGDQNKPTGTPPPADNVRSAVATEMFEMIQRLRSPALEQVLAFVHLLEQPEGVDARTTIESGCLRLVITAPMRQS
jgi:hypothetical protein